MLYTSGLLDLQLKGGVISYFMPRRVACLFLVLGLHILIICSLWPNGGAVSQSPVALPGLQYVFIAQSKPSAIHLPLRQTSGESAQNKIHKPVFSTTAVSTAADPALEFANSPEPKLDLARLRANAAQQELSRARSPLEQQQESSHQNRTLEARLERGTKKAQHTDCRSIYAQNGLFAPLFIAKDLLTEKGCQF